MTMEAFLVPFLGIMAATVGWLLTILAGGIHGTRHGARIVRQRAARQLGVKRTPKRVSRKSSRPRHRKGPSKTIRVLVQPAQGKRTASSIPNSLTAVSACPSCGLVAPNELMVEHFSGSPSHEKGTAREEPKQAVPEAKLNTAAQSDDTSAALRRIIQILIPPRAFGRRQREKTENPLSRIVYQLDTARKTAVRPLPPDVELLESRPEAMVRKVPDSAAF